MLRWRGQPDLHRIRIPTRLASSSVKVPGHGRQAHDRERKRSRSSSTTVTTSRPAASAPTGSPTRSSTRSSGSEEEPGLSRPHLDPRFPSSLAAGKCFNRLRRGLHRGPRGPRPLPNARKYMQSGEVQLTEWSNYALDARLKAAADGVSFGIVRSMLGTDTFKMSAAKVIECPFTGKKYAAVPGLLAGCGGHPRPRSRHVRQLGHQRHLRGRPGAGPGGQAPDRHAPRRSSPTRSSARTPPHTSIPFYLVDAVVEAPYGSYPGNMAYCYFSDERTSPSG